MKNKAMTQKIYISGKISGLKKTEYERNFTMAHKAIRTMGIFELYDFHGKLRIVNPLNIKPIFGVKKWLFFMIADLIALKKCTHIAMQPNWTDSRGAVIEYYFAKFIFKQKVILL